VTARRLAVVAVVAGLLRASAGAAHGLDPALLSLRAIGGGRWDVTWRTAAARLPGADVEPILPARCRRIAAEPPETTLEHVTLRWSVDCCAGPLAGETIGVTDLDAARINALLRIEESGRPTVQVVLNARRASFTVPAELTRLAVLRSYGALGVEHILTGPDHLLFVFGLLLLVSTTPLLVRTITAFTVGHSVTLSAAALGLATLPSRPMEVLIALSVLVLAVEATDHRARPTLVRRFPWLAALAFGLLHGFGFAGALAEAGLPRADIPLALVSFNAGIEAGQLAFVAVVLLAGALATRRVPALAARARWPAVRAMGILAAFWCFERTALWLGAL
jgi:hydrogenase/urease accessory protein HupE